MGLHRVKKGLSLPITGEPEQVIDSARPPSNVALLGHDYAGMRPKMRVSVGDVVRRGQPLFEDRKTPAVRYTSPGAGVVAAINRGERRALQSVVIELNENERTGRVSEADHAVFASYTGKDVVVLSSAEIRALLVESGLWTAFRTRPFSRIPDPQTTPHAIFVTAIDTHPLAPDPQVIVREQEKAFSLGMLCVAKLTEGRRYLCRAPGAAIPVDHHSGFFAEEFEGPHPAGTVGLHIHLLDPAHRDKTVWHIDYQDVIAIGHLLATGKLDVERVVALGGPQVKRPRLLRTRLGAATDDLVRDELKDGDNRVISGPVLTGFKASGEVLGYLGRYHHQISVLREGRERAFLGWLAPGMHTFSVFPAFLSKLLPQRRFDFTTTANGAARAMVPIGAYERVMPMDILPTFLLRALAVGDLERAEALGCLELDEEDLALCSFVSPGKTDYGLMLRNVLRAIEKEG